MEGKGGAAPKTAELRPLGVVCRPSEMRFRPGVVAWALDALGVGWVGEVTADELPAPDFALDNCFAVILPHMAPRDPGVAVEAPGVTAPLASDGAFLADGVTGAIAFPLIVERPAGVARPDITDAELLEEATEADL